MSRKAKIIYGIVAIVLVFISSAIGLWLLGNGDYVNSRSQFIIQFFLMVTPTIVVLAIINLLRKDN